MASTRNDLSSLTNPLVTPEQLSASSSQLDGVPAELEASLRFASAHLTQAAGILLRLPQELITQAIVILYRFYVGPEGGSFVINSAKDVSAASLYLTTKPSFHPISPRSLLNVYAYLSSPVSPLRTTADITKPYSESYYLSEADYQSQRSNLFQTEAIILRAIAFTTQVITPHHLALTYLQSLSVLPSPPTEKSRALARRSIEHLNTALLSPQLLYLTHQPCSLAVAAIYLAARETEVSLAGEWWEVFDCEREELGFLVVGMLSAERWVREEKNMWEGRGRACPLVVDDLREEIEKRKKGDE